MKKAFTSICNIVSAPIIGSLYGLAAITGDMAFCILIDITSGKQRTGFILSSLWNTISSVFGDIGTIIDWLSFIFKLLKYAIKSATTPDYFSGYFSNINYIPIVLFFCIFFSLIISFIIKILYLDYLDKNDSKTIKIISFSICFIFFIYTSFHLSYSTLKGILESHLSFSLNSRIGLYYTTLSIIVLLFVLSAYWILSNTEENQLNTEKTKEKEQQEDTAMFHCPNCDIDFDANRYDTAMFHCSNCGNDFETKRYITRKTFDADSMTITTIYFPMKCPNCGDWATTPKTIQQQKPSCTEA